MAMNQWLAEMYGTNGANEAQTKTAELELFAKLAADNGIDLSKLSQQQVQALYAETFGKRAEEGEVEEEAKEEAEEEKVEQAVAEHEEQKESAAKLAEADMMGRVMAHALVNELGQIEKQAAMPAALAKGLESARGAVGAVQKAERGASHGVGSTIRGGVERAAKALGKKSPLHSEKDVRLGRAALGTAAGAAAAIGGGIAATRGKKKESSAFDTLAAEGAIKMAGAAGYDIDEAYNRINAVYTLGLGESEKVGHIANTGDALHVRSLEYLENAGYPVNWEEVFGG